jgi:hypothetical protein
LDYSQFVDESGVEDWWVPHFKKHENLLLNALEYSGGTHNLEDVAMALHKDNMQLWPTDESVLVTEVMQYPRSKHMHVFLGAGNMDGLIYTMPYVIKQAKIDGCSKVTVTGRRGWEKVLTRLINCKPSHYWLSLEI